jgi:hypothetical protein
VIEKIFERGRVGWSRDGVPWPKGKGTLGWKNLTIEKNFILDR